MSANNDNNFVNLNKINTGKHCSRQHINTLTTIGAELKCNSNITKNVTTVHVTIVKLQLIYGNLNSS